jgi:hypothetical protein
MAVVIGLSLVRASHPWPPSRASRMASTNILYFYCSNDSSHSSTSNKKLAKRSFGLGLKGAPKSCSSSWTNTMRVKWPYPSNVPPLLGIYPAMHDSKSNPSTLGGGAKTAPTHRNVHDLIAPSGCCCLWRRSDVNDLAPSRGARQLSSFALPYSTTSAH